MLSKLLKKERGNTVVSAMLWIAVMVVVTGAISAVLLTTVNTSISRGKTDTLQIY